MEFGQKNFFVKLIYLISLCTCWVGFSRNFGQKLCFYFRYLLGWVNKLRSEHDQDDMFLGNARYYLSKAREVHTKNPTKDKEMMNHINELLNEIGPEEDDKENGENETDNLWEDLDDESDEEDEGNTNGMMEQT